MAAAFGAAAAARGALVVVVFAAAVAGAGAFAAAAAARALVGLPVGLGSFTVPAMTSLKYLPGRNAGTVVFFTLTASPVRGLRAVRAARSALFEDAEAGDGNVSALLHLALDQIDKAFDRGLRGLLVSVQPLSELVDQIGLVHCPSQDSPAHGRVGADWSLTVGAKSPERQPATRRSQCVLTVLTAIRSRSRARTGVSEVTLSDR